MRLLTSCLFCLLSSLGFCDQSVTLAWDANAEVDVVSYVVYYGETSRQYPNITNVGNVTTATIHGLEEGRQYYFAITAVNMAGLESDFSNEISNFIQPVIEWVTLSIQEKTRPNGKWKDLVTVNKFLDGTNRFFRIGISLPVLTNYPDNIPIDTNGFPPLPPGNP